MSPSPTGVDTAQRGERDAAERTVASTCHVVFDMTHAGRIQTGVGGYARNLMATLRDSFDVGVSPVAAPRPFDGRAGFLSRISRSAFELMWTEFGLRSELQRIKPDLLHAPAFVSTLTAPCPLVVTIHDLAYLHVPNCHNKAWLWYLKLLAPQVARRAGAVITVSEHARRDVLRHFDLSPKKVHAVYPGVDQTRFRPLSPVEAAGAARRYGLDAPFVLHVGSLAARKNIPTLLDAVFRLKKANFWKDRCVVLAGGASPGLPGHAEVLATIEKLGLRQEVRLLGHVSDDDLPAIYSLSEVVAMPTLYEGFGSPVAEAMACGRPVVASNRSSLPEVAGDAAVLVDPTDSEAWAEALSQVLTDEGLRQGMVERGLARAKRYTWQNTAEDTLRVYRGVLGERRVS